MMRILNNHIFKIFLALAFLAALLGQTLGCVNTSREKRESTLEQQRPLTKIEQLLVSAREFAKGLESVSNLKESFDKFSDAELTELAEEKGAAQDFAQYIVTGEISSDSIDIITKFLDAKRSNEAKLRLKGSIPNFIKIIRNKNRPKGESLVEKRRLLNDLLNRYPQEINQYSLNNGLLDIASFNDVVKNLPAKQGAALVSVLRKDLLDQWFSWAVLPANLTEAKAIFKAIYPELGAGQGEMRNRLLAKLYVKDLAKRVTNITSFIDDADAWGLKTGLNGDSFTLELTLGTTYTGSLLYVLTKAEISNNGAAGSPGPSYRALRQYAEKFKSAVGVANFLIHVRVALWGNAPQETIEKALTDALTPLIFQHLVNYFIYLDAPFEDILAPGIAINGALDVWKAADDMAQITNERLLELYPFIVDSDQKAVDLAHLHLPADARRYMHLLAARPVDAKGDLFNLFKKFIENIHAQAGGGALGDANVLARLVDISGGMAPLKILADTTRAGDDPGQMAKIFELLLKYDQSGPAGATQHLSAAELKARVKNAFDNRLAGGFGKDDFKKLYDKVDNAQKQIMRSELLSRYALLGPNGIEDFIKQTPAWNLNSLHLDAYDFKGKNGNLLNVLTDIAIADSTGKTIALAKPFFLVLQKNAASLKATMGPQYDAAYVNPSKVALSAHMNAHFSSMLEFSDYYLANPSVENVYQAACRPLAQVNNEILKDLYTLVVDDQSKIKALGQQPQPANALFDNFLGCLLNREPDNKGDLSFLVSHFLDGIYVEAGGGVAGENAERVQLDYQKAAVPVATPLANLFASQQVPGILPPYVGPPLLQGQMRLEFTQRLNILNRVLKNAQAGAFVNIDQKDDVGKYSIVFLSEPKEFAVNDPKAFKKIYGFLANNSAGAQAMRSALLKDAYNKGMIETANFIKSIIAVGDPLGLVAGLANDSYTLPRGSTVPPGSVTGSLLYALTQRTVDDIATMFLDDLRDPAHLIHTHLGAHAFANYATVAQWNGQTTKQVLDAHLGPTRSFFSNFYLGILDPQDVLNAVQQSEVNVSNATLKEIFSRVIGFDKDQAYALAQLAQPNPGFINHLMERSADPFGNTAWILNKFLDGLNAYGVAHGGAPGGVTEEQNELNRFNAGAEAPIVTLAKDGRLVADDMMQKLIMVERLARNDNSAAKGIPAAGISKLDFYKLGQCGQNAFKNLYSAVVTAPPNAVLAKAMRGALLAQVDAKNELPRFVSQIVDQKTWGLASTLDVDTYELAKIPAATKLHDGTLIYVLTLRAIDFALFNKKKPVMVQESYARLKGQAKEIAQAFAAVKMDYPTYVVINAPQDALTLLKAQLDAQKPGRAEDILHMPLTVQTVIDAAAGAKPLFNNIKNLFDTTIKSGIEAKQLSKLQKNGQSFLQHLIQNKEPGVPLDALVNKYLNQLEDQAALKNFMNPLFVKGEATNKQIKQHTAAGINSLRILLQIKLVDIKASHRKLMLDWAKSSKRALKEVTGAEVETLLDTVEQLKALPDLTTILAGLSDTAIIEAAKWCVRHATLAGIGPYLQAAYAGRAAKPAVQKSLRNAVILEAAKEYLINPTSINLSDGLARMADVIIHQLLPDIVIKGAEFDPLPSGVDATLLYALFKTLPPANKRDWVQIVTPLRALFLTDAEWQLYLDTKNNGAAAEAIHDAVKASLPGKPGFADYYLEYPTISQKKVFANAGIAIADFDIRALKYLYGKAIKTDLEAHQLLSIAPGIDGNNFLQKLVKHPLSSIFAEIILDVLQRNYNHGFTAGGVVQGIANLDATIGAMNVGGQNALQILLKNKNIHIAGKDYKTDIDARLSLIYLLTSLSEATVATLADPKDLNRLLDTVFSLSEAQEKAKLIARLTPKKGGHPGNMGVLNFITSMNTSLGAIGLTADLPKVFSHLNKALLPELSAWSGMHAESAHIGNAFNQLYGLGTTSVPEQQIMRNAAVKAAFDEGAKNGIEDGVNHVAQLIENGFFDDATLKSTSFDPFGAGGNSTLLYAVLHKIGAGQIADDRYLNRIIMAFIHKANFDLTPGNSWQDYLQKDAPQDIVNLVAGYAAGDIVKAQTWLQW